MLSEHIEKYHDSDFEPQNEPEERANLRGIQHHLAGSLIGEDGKPLAALSAPSANAGDEIARLTDERDRFRAAWNEEVRLRQNLQIELNALKSGQSKAVAWLVKCESKGQKYTDVYFDRSRADDHLGAMKECGYKNAELVPLYATPPAVASSEAVAWQWCAYQDGFQRTGWNFEGTNDQAKWEAFAIKSPETCRIVKRALYATPASSLGVEEIARIEHGLNCAKMICDEIDEIGHPTDDDMFEDNKEAIDKAIGILASLGRGQSDGPAPGASVDENVLRSRLQRSVEQYRRYSDEAVFSGKHVANIIECALTSPWPIQSAAQGGERTAPSSCPNCFNEDDCGNVDVCNAVAEVYPSDPPAQESAHNIGDE